MLFISVLFVGYPVLYFCKDILLPKASLTVLTSCCSIAVFWVVFFPPFICGKRILFGILSGLLFALCAGLVSFLVFQNDFTAAGAGKAAAVLISGALGEF